MAPSPRSSERRPRIARPRRLLETLSDERLGAAFKRGEDQAFAALYERHVPGLLAFSRQLLGSVQEAEDAVQHTMLAASNELLDGAADLHLRPWLYVVARNRCLSILRGPREEPLERAPVPITAGLSEQVQQSAELQAVLADLARLPEDQRTALVLAELGDLSHAEIAEVLGCGRERIKALVFQAREALMTMRRARDADCATVREQLATLTGGALRRRELRAHLRSCEGCRDYRSEVRRQRAAMALVLPVVPTDALREAVLGTIGVGGGGALVAFGAAGGGGATLATKAAATLAATGALVGGAVVATRDEPPQPAREAAAEQRTKPERTSVQPGVAAVEKDRSAALDKHDKPQRRERARQSQRRGNSPDRARGRNRSAAGSAGRTAGSETGPPASAPPAAAPAVGVDANRGNSGNNAGKGATASPGNTRSSTVSKGAQGALRSNPRSEGGGAAQPKRERGSAPDAPERPVKSVRGNQPGASSGNRKPDTPPGRTRKEEQSN